MQQATLMPALVPAIRFCRRCGRSLSNAHSMQAGMGPVCRGHGKGIAMGGSDAKQLDEPFDAETLDVLCRRVTGDLRCNIPHRHINHSPTGFECGYLGSGPSDLALNIMALHLPLAPGDQGVELNDGTYVSWEAWRLYDAFKRAFVATMDRDGGVIAGSRVKEWIATQAALE
jgi:hypothetical protein